MQSQLEAGKLRLLATFSEERLANYPDLPTVIESGYDVVVRKFRGLAGPKGLPEDVIVGISNSRGASRFEVPVSLRIGQSTRRVHAA